MFFDLWSMISYFLVFHPSDCFPQSGYWWHFTSMIHGLWFHVLWSMINGLWFHVIWSMIYDLWFHVLWYFIHLTASLSLGTDTLHVLWSMINGLWFHLTGSLSLPWSMVPHPSDSISLGTDYLHPYSIVLDSCDWWISDFYDYHVSLSGSKGTTLCIHGQWTRIHVLWSFIHLTKNFSVSLNLWSMVYDSMFYNP